MGQNQMHALTNMFVAKTTHTLKCSIKCGIHHTPEARDSKLVCDVPHLCQFIPIKTCIKARLQKS